LEKTSEVVSAATEELDTSDEMITGVGVLEKDVLLDETIGVYEGT